LIPLLTGRSEQGLVQVLVDAMFRGPLKGS
jgi:hypothetical protein